ncbi:hypothetical protein LZD49_28375 [Dyadobacter sp. CY261]|uniref:hypothetical protein n=1 Tax=Dyadobacter sp. CY261 TaxID=2907203 RepID=UPI001F450C58|nr:hypothetical protein [Dyadobacter sp. CY261]MCF0074434.1 hypothetical protein [Dyadobacter sp. CY261]
MKTQKTRICLIGLGPSGIGFLWKYLQDGLDPSEILCIEAGPRLAYRNCPVLDYKECNYKKVCHITSGFGGSSVMAGGKVSLYPAGSGLTNILDDSAYIERKIKESAQVYEQNLQLKRHVNLPEMHEQAKSYYNGLGYEFKYYDAALYSQKDFFNVNQKFEEDFIRAGIEIRFNTMVTDIEIHDGRYIVHIFNKSNLEVLSCEKVILATGKSGHNLADKLSKKFGVESRAEKAEIGVRVEFPISAFPDIDKFHYDLKLKSGNCKTFCVSKGGKIALYYSDNLLYTEGYDDYKNPTSFTNLGILYKLDAENHDITTIIEDIILKRKNNGLIKPIRQTYFDFLNSIESNEFNYESSIKSWEKGDINEFLPNQISHRLRDEVKSFVSSFVHKDYRSRTSIFFPEMNYQKTSFKLAEDFQCLPNFYVIGEITGKFIGILQSFASGMICAETYKK